MAPYLPAIHHGIHGAPALGILFSLIDAGSAFAACTDTSSVHEVVKTWCITWGCRTEQVQMKLSTFIEGTAAEGLQSKQQTASLFIEKEEFML
eukprot:1149067-Pelagomonas_calceolata.AAC.1